MPKLLKEIRSDKLDIFLRRTRDDIDSMATKIASGPFSKTDPAYIIELRDILRNCADKIDLLIRKG